jgi:hypothetical protein
MCRAGFVFEAEATWRSRWLTLLDFDLPVAFAAGPAEFDGVDGRGSW